MVLVMVDNGCTYILYENFDIGILALILASCRKMAKWKLALWLQSKSKCQCKKLMVVLTISKHVI